MSQETLIKYRDETVIGLKGEPVVDKDRVINILLDAIAQGATAAQVGVIINEVNIPERSLVETQQLFKYLDALVINN